MSQDTEDNGIQTNIGAPEIDEAIDDIEDVETFVTTVERPDDRVSNTVMLSQFSSVSSTSKAEGLFSKETQLLTQPAFINAQESVTLDALTQQINTPDLTDFTFSGGMDSIFGGIDSYRNSSSLLLNTSNETLMQLSSSWSPEEIGAVLIVSLMVPFILLSNIFVIISVVRFRRLHTPTNYFITSLAAVDIFVAVATPFGIVVEVFNFGGIVGPKDVVLCLLPNRILMMACGVSVLTLATIAYDRHTALVSSLEYINIMTPKKVAIMVSLTWLYSAVIVWLPLMAGWYSLPSEVEPCSANLIHGKAPLLFLSAIFVPSCVVIFVCYFRIFMVARHHAKAIAAVEFAVHRHLQVRFMIKDTKYAKTLALVIGVFLLLWLPYLIFIFVQTVCSTSFNIWIQTYLILLTVFNSGINPWIYAFKNNELRAAFKRLFREMCRHKVCRSADKRTSLVSGISVTPRLSRTDSRMASIQPEATMYTVCEKLKKSLDSLDEQTKEIHSEAYENQSRRQTISVEVSPPLSFGFNKQSLRQAASCSDLDTAKGGDTERTESVTRSRSFSVDFTLTGDASEENETNVREMNESYCQLPGHPEASICENNMYTCDKIFSTQSSNTSTISSALTQIVPLQLSSIHVQSPSTSSIQSSVLDSHSLVFSLTNNLDESKHTSLPHTTTEVTELPQSLPHQHLRHTYSLDHLQESLAPGTYWQDSYCQDNLAEAAFHPYFQNIQQSIHYPNFYEPVTPPQSRDHHILTHTHSCPIFEPITSYQLVFPQTIHEDIGPCHQGKVSSPLQQKRLDFVSLVNREAKHSCSDRYLV